MRLSAVLALFLMVFNFPAIGFGADEIPTGFRAVAAGCGSKIYTDDHESAKIAVDEISKCYQKGIEENFRFRLTPLGTAFELCSSFEIEVQQYLCLLRYKEEAKDPSLYKLFGECVNSEKNALKKTNLTYECIKKNKVKFQSKNNEEIELSKTNVAYLKFIGETCGSHDGILATNAIEVSNLADCYQRALLNSVKTSFTPATLALNLCENFEYNLNKMNCIERAKASAKDPKIDYALQLCAKRDPQYPEKKERQSGWDYSNKKLGVKWACVQDEFQRVAVDPAFVVPVATKGKKDNSKTGIR